MSNRLTSLALGSTTLAIACIALVHCVQLDDGGNEPKVWGTAAQIHDDGTASAVALDPAGNAVAVWSQTDGVWSSRCTPDGVCGTAERISHGTPVLVADDAAVAMDDAGNAVAVWSQFFVQNNIYSNRYTPSAGWGIPQRLDDRSGEAFAPQVSMGADGTAVAVWAQFDGGLGGVWSNRYAPGERWSVPRPIGTTSAARVSGPQVALDADGNGVAVWAQSDDTRFDIWSNRYTRSSDWADATPIEANDAGDALAPQVALDAQGNAVVVWQQSDGTRDDVWANRYTSSDGWGAAERIEAEEEDDSLDPQLGVGSDGAAVAVWVKLGDSGDIWANRYTPTDGWGTSEPIEANGSRDALEPGIAVDAEGNAAAVWRQINAVDDRIWTSRYTPTDGWGPAASIDDAATGARSAPQVSMNPSGNAVAAWTVFGESGTGIWSNRMD